MPVSSKCKISKSCYKDSPGSKQESINIPALHIVSCKRKPYSNQGMYGCKDNKRNIEVNNVKRICQASCHESKMADTAITCYH